VQTTLRSPIFFTGIGLHYGQKVRMKVNPADPGSGIRFRRVDIHEAGKDNMVPARWDAVTSSRLCTELANGENVSVSTVEHLMAALAGCGVRDALIEIHGPEVPILDGSSAPFVSAFVRGGFRTVNAPVRAIRILEPVEERDGEALARIEPAEEFEIDFSIEFDDAAIGSQKKSLKMANGAFISELCDSRTFCRQKDVESMRRERRALGGTLENAIVVDGDRVLNPGGLRYPDEPVRHKMLDVMGDLALAGHPILGRYTGVRASHALTNRLLKKLFSRRGAFRLVSCDARTVARLPGADIGDSRPRKA